MIRIGIVGCGRILNAHLQGFQQLRASGVEGFRITALVARQEADAWMFHTRGQGPPPRPSVLPAGSSDPLAAPHTYVSDFQNDVEVRVYTDYRRLIDAGVVDAVLDNSPVYLHHSVGLAALDAGLHLLTQKPLAVTVRAARQMVEKARARGLSLGTFENARYSPVVRASRWAFDAGLLGQPQMAVHGAIGGRWSPDRITAGTPWRHDKLRAGGGGSIDIGVHQLDVLRYLLGEVRAVQALVRTFEPERIARDPAGGVLQRVPANVDDTYFAGVSCVNGAVAQLLWSWAAHGEPLEFPGTPAYYGSKGCIKAGQLILDDGFRGSVLDRFQQEASADARERFFPMGLTDSFTLVQLDWLRAIEAGADMETSGEEGLRDLAAAYAILESDVAGRAVTLDEVLSGAVNGYQREIDDYYRLG